MDDSRRIRAYVSACGYHSLAPARLATLCLSTEALDAERRRGLVFTEMLDQEHLAHDLTLDGGDQHATKREAAQQLLVQSHGTLGTDDRRHIGRVVQWVRDHGGLSDSTLQTLSYHIYGETDSQHWDAAASTALVLLDAQWTYVGHVYVWLGAWIPNETCFMGIRKRLTLLTKRYPTAPPTRGVKRKLDDTEHKPNISSSSSTSINSSRSTGHRSSSESTTTSKSYDSE